MLAPYMLSSCVRLSVRLSVTNAKDLGEFLIGSPLTWAQNVGWVGKIPPYRRESMFLRHVGPRRRQCAGGGMRGVINNVGRSRSLLITLTAHLSIT